jgi:hypothetical protein
MEDDMKLRETIAHIVHGATGYNDDSFSRADKILELTRQSEESIKDERLEKYEQLIYAVASKFPNESRFETALRYIQQRVAWLRRTTNDR